MAGAEDELECSLPLLGQQPCLVAAQIGEPFRNAVFLRALDVGSARPAAQQDARTDAVGAGGPRTAGRKVVGGDREPEDAKAARGSVELSRSNSDDFGHNAE